MPIDFNKYPQVIIMEDMAQQIFQETITKLKIYFAYVLHELKLQ